ncbi:MAG: polysaccharide deacetylase family protein [bacterium]|nr:polysaccharide deacetylase family protein [bacterium]
MKKKIIIIPCLITILSLGLFTFAKANFSIRDEIVQGVIDKIYNLIMPSIGSGGEQVEPTTSSSAVSGGVGVTYITNQTNDFAIGGTDSNASLWFDESAGNLLVNGMGLYQPTSESMFSPNETIIDNFTASSTGWVYTSGGGGFSQDYVDYAIATSSLSITTDNANTQTRVTKSNISPTFDMTNKNLEIVVKIDSLTYFDTATSQLFVAVSSDNLSSYKYITAAYPLVMYEPGNQWVKLRFSTWDFSLGNTDITAINSMRIYFKAKTGGTATLHINKISMIDKPIRPVISFNFDDGNESDFLLAKQKLSQYGYPATAFVIRDRETSANYLTLAQMTELQNIHGWDISAHGGTNFTTLTSSEMETEALSIKNYLLKNGFSKGADILAYPNGAMNTNIVLPIMQKYFKVGRLSSAGGNETLPLGNPFLIKNYPVSAASNTATSTVYAKIDDTITKKGWLALTFHRLVNSGATTVQYNVSDFNYIVDYIAPLVAAGKVDVKLYSDVINSYNPNILEMKNDKFGINTTTPQTNLDIKGIMSVYPKGTATATCSTLIEGAFMYSTGTKGFYFCNGSAWASF